MFALHIENEVTQYEAWKAAFDKYDRFRRDHGVLEYRIFRHPDDTHKVNVDLDFSTREEAEAFAVALRQVWATPQSQAVIVGHGQPQVWAVERRSLVAS